MNDQTHTWVTAYLSLGLRPIRLCAPRPDGTCSCTPQYHPGCTNRPKTSTGKRPIGKDWQTRRFSVQEFRPGENVGLAMGTQPDGRRIIAVDVDGALSDLGHIAADWPETLAAITGSGGFHLVYEWPSNLPLPPNAVRLPNTSVDIRSEGGQIVVCPSVHHTGRQYTWAVQVPIAPLPEDTARAILARAPAVVAPTVGVNLDRYTKDLADAFARAFPAHGYRHKACLALSGIILKRGWPEDRAVALLESVLRQTGWEYSEVEAENDVQCTAAKIQAGEPVQGFTALVQMLGMLGPEGAQVLEMFLRGLNLTDLLAKSDKGKVLPLDSNIERILGQHPACLGALAFDDFRQDIVQVAPLPATTVGRAAPTGSWTDVSATRIGNWICDQYGFNVPKTRMHEQAEALARRNAFHPVRDYLRRVKWDGTPRIHTLWSRYFGAEDSPYIQAVGRMFMIGAVARVFEPGCKHDTAPILVGAQGRGKSRALAALVPDRCWFSDTKIDVGTKDAMINLAGTWIYEFAELAAMKSADVETVKNFMSSGTDKFRVPYERRATQHPRQIVFVGSVNGSDGESVGFKDRTGNRRFWPVSVVRACDDVSLVRDRDQLWAEAYELYRAGVQWWGTSQVEDMCRQVQDDNTEQDPWEEQITEYLETLCAPTLQVLPGGILPNKTDPWDEGVTTARVLRDVIGKAVAQQNNYDLQRVGRILKERGWTRTRRQTHGIRDWCYLPGIPKPINWTR